MVFTSYAGMASDGFFVGSPTLKLQHLQLQLPHARDWLGSAVWHIQCVVKIRVLSWLLCGADPKTCWSRELPTSFFGRLAMGAGCSLHQPIFIRARFLSNRVSPSGTLCNKKCPDGSSLSQGPLLHRLMSTSPVLKTLLLILLQKLPGRTVSADNHTDMPTDDVRTNWRSAWGFTCLGFRV